MQIPCSCQDKMVSGNSKRNLRNFVKKKVERVIFILNWQWIKSSFFVKYSVILIWSFKNDRVHSLFIRTSKFCLRLAVLNFFFHFWGWNVLNLFLFPPTEPCNATEDCQTEYNKNTISFLSFFFFQAAHIGSHWEVFYKKAVLQLC